MTNQDNQPPWIHILFISSILSYLIILFVAPIVRGFPAEAFDDRYQFTQEGDINLGAILSIHAESRANDPERSRDGISHDATQGSETGTTTTVPTSGKDSQMLHPVESDDEGVDIDEDVDGSSDNDDRVDDKGRGVVGSGESTIERQKTGNSCHLDKLDSAKEEAHSKISKFSDNSSPHTDTKTSPSTASINENGDITNLRDQMHDDRNRNKLSNSGQSTANPKNIDAKGSSNVTVKSIQSMDGQKLNNPDLAEGIYTATSRDDITSTVATDKDTINTTSTIANRSSSRRKKDNAEMDSTSDQALPICGPEIANFQSLENMMAILFALDEINASDDLLPDITLGITILDDCFTPSLARTRALQFMPGASRLQETDKSGNHEQQRTRKRRHQGLRPMDDTHFERGKKERQPSLYEHNGQQQQQQQQQKHHHTEELQEQQERSQLEKPQQQQHMQLELKQQQIQKEQLRLTQQHQTGHQQQQQMPQHHRQQQERQKQQHHQQHHQKQQKHQQKHLLLQKSRHRNVQNEDTPTPVSNDNNHHHNHYHEHHLQHHHHQHIQNNPNQHPQPTPLDVPQHASHTARHKSEIKSLQAHQAPRQHHFSSFKRKIPESLFQTPKKQPTDNYIKSQRHLTQDNAISNNSHYPQAYKPHFKLNNTNINNSRTQDDRNKISSIFRHAVNLKRLPKLPRAIYSVNNFDPETNTNTNRQGLGTKQQKSTYNQTFSVTSSNKIVDGNFKLRKRHSHSWSRKLQHNHIKTLPVEEKKEILDDRNSASDINIKKRHRRLTLQVKRTLISREMKPFYSRRLTFKMETNKRTRKTRPLQLDGMKHNRGDNGDSVGDTQYKDTVEKESMASTESQQRKHSIRAAVSSQTLSMSAFSSFPSPSPSSTFPLPSSSTTPSLSPLPLPSTLSKTHLSPSSSLSSPLALLSPASSLALPFASSSSSPSSPSSSPLPSSTPESFPSSTSAHSSQTASTPKLQNTKLPKLAHQLRTPASAVPLTTSPSKTIMENLTAYHHVSQIQHQVAINRSRRELFRNNGPTKRQIPRPSNYRLPQFYDVVGIVGAYTSSLSVEVADVMTIFNLPQISHAATTDILGDNAKYPVFFRTIPADHYQIQTMADILRHFRWKYVSIVFSADAYGTRAEKSLKSLLHDFDICVAHSVELNDSMAIADYNNVIFTLRSHQNARVVVLYADIKHIAPLMTAVRKQNAYHEFIWAGSDTTSLVSDMEEENCKHIIGSLSITMNSAAPQKFKKYLYEYLLDNQEILRQSSKKDPEKTYALFHEFSDVDKLKPYIDEKYFGKAFIQYVPTFTVSYAIDAVYAFAHAIQLFINTNCPGATKSEAKRCLQGRSIIPFLRSVKFQGTSGSVSFNKYGDVVGRVAISQCQMQNRVAKQVPIATWDGQSQPTLNFHSPRQWPNESTSVPKSICADACIGNEIYVFPKQTCCWRCVKCKVNEITIKNKTHCSQCPDLYWPNERTYQTCHKIQPSYIRMLDLLPLALSVVSTLGLMVSFVTGFTFYTYRTDRIIRSSSRELSSVMLIGIFCGFLLVLSLLSEPTLLKCYINHVGFALIFTLVYGPLLVKTNRIYRIFTTSRKSAALPKRTSSAWQMLFASGFILVQVTIVVVSTLFDPPKVTFSQPVKTDKYVIGYCDLPLAGFLPSIAYNLALVLICTWYAFKTRRLPDNYNESRYIAFCVDTTVLVWISFIPTYFAMTRPYYKVVILALALLINSIVCLLLLFVPKLYALYISKQRHAGQNNRGDNAGDFHMQLMSNFSMSGLIRSTPSFYNGDSNDTDEKSDSVIIQSPIPPNKRTPLGASNLHSISEQGVHFVSSAAVLITANTETDS